LFADRRPEGTLMKGRRAQFPKTVWTIGHSNRSLEELLELLTVHGIDLLADVRTMPGSRHNPQFNRETLPPPLEAAGIEYVHLPSLGGLRRGQPDSPNGGWRNASFQGFADYMLTPEFEAGLEELLERIDGARACLMCAEAVPWRCHRSLIADALVVRRVDVEHILSGSRTQRHELHDWAHVEGTRITYPPATEEAQEPATVREKARAKAKAD
jgi:uncharacterized protein (DUF488 family)